MIPALSVVACGPAAMPISKMGFVRVKICLNMFGGSTVAVATSNWKMLKTLAPTSPACTSPTHWRCAQRRKDVCDRLEHLGQSSRLRRNGPISVAPHNSGQVNPLTSVFPYGTWVSPRSRAARGKCTALRILESIEDFLRMPFSTRRSPWQVLCGPRGHRTLEVA